VFYQVPAFGWTWAMPTKLMEKISMARPTKLDEEKLSETISFRVNKKDFLKFEGKRLAAGLDRSKFYRDHVANNTTKVIAKPAASADAKRAVFLLQKASNNLNQLAFRANASHRANQLAENTFDAIVDQLKQLNQFMIEQAGEATK